ncbi:glycerophosphodiester phosphodiesterase [Flavobacterium jejuense]|uniref:glycerophosphodiester phosphodiesterase n=1 Tax=Flavobacterium jejuense TaxID=1544455 RepID=UPI001AA08DEE|nr:glycerophosphodiester phosphodiesterase [Flavobacterium jejuense]
MILRNIFFSIGALLALACNNDDTVENVAPSSSKYPTLSGKDPLIVAHRGASGYLPEHTIASYTRAIELGADFIEPDLVMTLDGVLVVRHEPMLSGTTNVGDISAFASKKTTKNIDGAMVEDWFVSDFTLAEIKQLKAKQAFSERAQQFNNLYEIPTFTEVITLVKEKSAQLNRIIGIYPETKHPAYHEALNLKISDKLLEELTTAGWNSESAPVYVQSFEVSNLQYIRSKSTVKIIQLLSCYDVALNGDLIFDVPTGETVSYGKPYDWHLQGDTRDYSFFTTDAGLDFVKTYANGIGPWKPFIISYKGTDANNDGLADDMNADGKINDADKEAITPNNLIKRSHSRGLEVHAYTFRNESRRLLSNYHNNPILEYQAFYNLGLDGLFTDFTDTALLAR